MQVIFNIRNLLKKRSEAWGHYVYGVIGASIDPKKAFQQSCINKANPCDGVTKWTSGSDGLANFSADKEPEMMFFEAYRPRSLPKFILEQLLN